ncbi:MAG: hypothetical protein HOA17_06410 [Candidatus Melainabacteria bacterium]|jgi:hypothetical protein|nr:hypothetical protein [Candidatus Melainabacteria bacterium]
MSGQSLPETRKIAQQLSNNAKLARTGPRETALASVRDDNPSTALVANFGTGVRPEIKADTKNQLFSNYKPKGKNPSAASLGNIFGFMNGDEEMFG